MGFLNKLEEIKEKADLNRLGNMKDKIDFGEIKNKIIGNRKGEPEKAEELTDLSQLEDVDSGSEIPKRTVGSSKTTGGDLFREIGCRMKTGIVADVKDAFKNLFSKEGEPGSIFTMRLLFEEKCNMPKIKEMEEIMAKHVKSAEFIVNDGRVAAFDVMKYADYKNPNDKDDYTAPQLLIANCKAIGKWNVDEITRSQFWNCKGGDVYIDYCKYMVAASDLLGDMIGYKERANMLMDFLEALMEMFPSCRAVFFDNSGTLFTREQIITHELPRDERFLTFAVNKRFFTVEGSSAMVVDTLGMSTLHLPDIQYHFHDANPNDVANHVLDVIYHLYSHGCSIESGDKIDGMMTGDLWTCRYEAALVSPLRPVLDIDMGRFAAGKR